ncbi:hypothetical protein BDA99DRAFT_503102 [Phascolomyces articulosus]|uniref:START domain-containing protein n=1 Tax=Phascolomyces articulosus TaxID=60185 RepID=A0AAD5K4F1_9FUNG|nr:hypothetical protein BDA99DRAFT_503102 [Phascolomyces articulosus]
MNPIKTSPQHDHERLESRLDILRGAINRFSHIINTDKQQQWKKLKTQNFSRSSRIHVHKRSGGASDIYKIQLDIPSRTDRTWSTTSWHALFQSVGTRKLWDQMMESVQILNRPSSNTLITHRTFKGSKEGCVFAEKITRKTNMIRHIATTTTPRRDDEQDAIACPALAGYDVRISPEDAPNLDSRVTFYYEIVSPTLSEDAIEPYVVSLVTGPLSTLALHGAPPGIIREPNATIKNVIYDSDQRVWELVYEVLNASNHRDGTGGGGSEPASPSTAVGSITIQTPRKGSFASASIPWQGGGSWDRGTTSPLQLASSLRHRRGSFMGSLLLPTQPSPTSSSSFSHTRGFSKSSASAFSPSSPRQLSSKQQQKIPTSSTGFSSSYTFGKDHLTDKKNGRMELRCTPDIVIELDSQTWALRSIVDIQLDVNVAGIGKLDSKMVDRFAQLCIRCYAEQQTGASVAAQEMDDHDNERYFLTLYHPPQLLQYLMEGNDAANLTREPTVFGTPRDEITVKLQLSPRKRKVKEYISSSSSSSSLPSPLLEQQDPMHFALFVNGKEWPFRSWMGEAVFIDESSGSSVSSDDYDEEANIDTDDDDHGVFADNMEDTDGIDEGDFTMTTDTTTQKLVSSIELEPIVAAPKTSHSEKTTTSLSSTENQHDTSNVVSSVGRRTVNDDNVSLEDSGHEELEEEEVQEEEAKPRLSEEGEAEDIMIVPETDPEPVLKMRQYFDKLIGSDKWHVLQPPESSNLYVTIRKLDVPGHPTGAYLSESIWKDCSVWDVKAVVSCIGARKIWDSTYEDGIFLHQVSKTCSLWHHKTKGFWTVSARDYVAFSSAYTSASCIDICSTSCTSDSYDHHALPTSAAGFVRARLDLWNWRLERLDMNTTSVKLINQANLQGWIPSYVPNSFSGHNPDLVMRAHQFFNKHGAPPDLTILEHGSLVNTSYDHHRQSWRCEYTQSATATTNDQAASASSSSTLAEVRIRKRSRRGYNVVIDPPPSSVKASTRTHDPYGVWLEISHRESDIIPHRGKILLLIKPGILEGQDQLVINGDVAVVHKDLAKSMKIKEKPLPLDEIDEDDGEPPPQITPQQRQRPSPIIKTATSSTAVPQPTVESTTEPNKQPENEEKTDESTEDNSITATIESLPKSPEMIAQSALAFLTRVSDQQFGWSNSTDKNGLTVSKRSGTAKLTNNSAETITQTFIGGEQMEIPEPSIIIKASKVIEGFSLEEVASIVTNTGNLRKQYDESVEEIEVLARTSNGCQIVRQLIKGIFPFKSREIFVSSCTAHEKAHLTTNPAAKRILYVEASIPNFPTTSDPSKRPPALFSLSGWILEAIDPYTTTTNHPIPSMRATHLTSLDLGSSVPTYMSNLVTTGFPKRMKAIEKLLHTQGPSPYLGQPYVAQAFTNGKLLDDLSVQGPIQWTMVDTSYDKDKFVFKCDANFQLSSSPKKPSSIVANMAPLPSKSNLSTSLLKSKQYQQQQQQPQQGSSFTGSITTSTSTGSISSVTTSGSTVKGGSTNNSSHPSIAQVGSTTTPPPSSTTTTSKTSGSSSTKSTDTGITLLRTIIDLRNYSKGYEIMINMKRRSNSNSNNNNNFNDEKDVSSTLSVNVSELAPEPSHLIANTNSEIVPRKHAVEISATTIASLTHDKIYALELQLIPVTEECLQKRGTRLTISGVLGEDDGKWHGVVVLNGKEMDVGSTVEVAAPLPLIDSPILSQFQQLHHDSGSSDQLDQDGQHQLLSQKQQHQHLDAHANEGETDQDEEPHEETVSMLGSGVVAAALGGVSASVNQIQDFRARMLLPFRSTSFLSGTPAEDDDDVFESPISSPSNSSSEGKEKKKDGDQNQASSSLPLQTKTTRHRRRSRHRSTSDVIAKRASSSRGRSSSTSMTNHTSRPTTINKSGFIAMLLLLFLLLIATMQVPTKDEVLDIYLNATKLRQLWRIPWMGGWHIEIIAVQQRS